MKRIIGYYNELEYRVELDGTEIYQAGNSPFESQTYTSARLGVGLDKMREFCEQTSKELAIEHKATLIGIEYLENDKTRRLIMYYVGYKGKGRAEIYLSAIPFTESYHPDGVKFAFGGYRTRKQAERVAMFQNYGLDNDWNKRIKRFVI